MSVFMWVELDLFSLECSDVSNSDFWLYMGLVWLWASHLLLFRVVFLFYWRISMVCLSLEFAISWEEPGFSVCMLKSRDITLPTKVHLVKAMVFPVVVYGCDSQTVKKAECQRIDL